MSHLEYGIVGCWGEFFTHPISSIIARVRLNYGKQAGYIKYAIYSLHFRHHNPAIQKRTLSSRVRLFFVTGISLFG
ncbi:hypothetical protein WH390_14525 (plasmid) [Candidatus Arsenophonus nilaparvatae]|uniref:hypothetical protein n=1 Tax=Candidatus Arsenophonus nilaparvatae TaxID=1247023 RepID=UPI003877B9BE